ncbi:hypothetical protein L208DRAFT_1374300 [Tricholoma matsutake]|nr:hypothetical protein L208DRAFT_1374300 [Tricholoma matsutake 945]
MLKDGSEHASEVKKLAMSTNLKGKSTSRRAAAWIESSASEDEEVLLQKVHSKVAKQPTIVESDSEQRGKGPSPEALFDDDIEVDDSGTQDLVLAATTQSHRSSRSSCYSNLPLTDSDGFHSEHGDHDSGDNDNNQDSVCKHEVTNVKVRKHAHKKKKGHHSNVFQAEVPVVDQSSGEKIKMEKKPITTANSEWPRHAQLVPPPSGKDLHLNDQHVFIQFVVQGAIADITVQILADHSFPETDQKLKFRRQTLQNAACHRCSEFLPIVDIYERIVEDINFSNALGELVKSVLTVSLHCLIERHLYFLDPGALMPQQEKCTKGEPELPIAMVALGATGVYAVLSEWKSGSRISVKFKGNIFGSIYKILLQTLERIKTQKPKVFHAIMLKLYSLVVTSHLIEPQGVGALELMDLDSDGY